MNRELTDVAVSDYCALGGCNSRQAQYAEGARDTKATVAV